MKRKRYVRTYEIVIVYLAAGLVLVAGLAAIAAWLKGF